jgi:5-methylcytosine-specific restriction endonuclease McrA
VPDNVRYCDECRAEKQQAGTPVEKPSGAARSMDDAIQREYMGKLWREGTRRRALQRHPFCTGEGCNALSAVVDHKIPARVVHAECVRRGLFPLQRIKGFHLLDNLTGLCHSCHNEKTAHEAGQYWGEELDKLLSRFKPGICIV